MDAREALPLATAFLTALSESVRAAAPPAGDIEEALRELVRSAESAWPELALPHDVFIRYLATKVADAEIDGTEVLRKLSSLRVADLYLVCACRRGDGAAIVAFETHYVARLDRALSRMGIEPAAIDDLKGMLRDKALFPEEGARSLLDGYSGRGDVGRWLRAVAVRAAAKASRTDRNVFDLDVAQLVMPGDGPEIAYLKATFASEFKSALSEAMEALPVRDRGLLRQYFLDDLTYDELGRIHRVHSVTALRWIARLRKELLEEVSRQLMKRLRLSAEELQSVLRVVGSRLDASIHRLLAEGS